MALRATLTLTLTAQMIRLIWTVIGVIKREHVGTVTEHGSPDPVRVVIFKFLLLCVDVIQLLLGLNHCRVPSVAKT